MIVVRRRPGAKISRRLGRLSVPASFFRCHTGDSGRNGRMIIKGIAGIRPDISVYRQAACGSGLFSPRRSRKSGNGIAGSEAAQARAAELAKAISNPPIDENAWV